MTQAHDRGTGAIELLQRDHDKVRRLLSELAASPAGTIPAGVKHVLDLLDGLDPADGEFELLLRQLASICRAHLEFEEDRVWPGVRLALSEQELASLGVKLSQGRRLAPTRPHPAIPPDPEAQRLAGRIAGATDRIRDALTGRSRI